MSRKIFLDGSGRVQHLEGISTLEELVSTGNELLDGHKFVAAQQLFMRAIEKDECSFEAFYGVGLCHMRKGNYELAKKNIQEARDLGHEGYEFFRDMALIEKFLGDDNRARKFSVRLIESEDLVLLNHAVLCLSQMGFYDDARDACERLKELAPDMTTTYSIEGIMEFSKRTPDSFERARKLFDKALEIDPGNFDAIRYMAHTFIDTDPKKAEEYAKKGLELYSDHFPLKGLLANTILQQERFEEAKELFLKNIETDPNDPESYIGVGTSLIGLKRFDEALEYIEKALQTFPMLPGTHAKKGMIKHNLGELGEAEESYQTSIRLNPMLYEGHHGLASVYLEMGRDIESLYHVLSALAIEPRTEVFETQKEVFLRFGSVNELLNQCASFLDNNPEYQGILHLAAALFETVGDPEMAKEHNDKIFSMLKSAPDLKERLRSFGSSAHSVSADISNPISNNLYVIKTNDKGKRGYFEEKRLRREHDITLGVNTILMEYLDQESSRTIACPLGIFKDRNHDIFLVLKTLGKRNLQQVIDEGEDVRDYVQNTLMDLATMHAVVTENMDGHRIRFSYEGKDHSVPLNDFNYAKDLNNRLLKRFPGKSSHFKKKMLDFMKKNTVDQEFFIHGDLYLKNVLDTGAIIDFERAAIGDPMADVALLLLSTGLIDNKDMLNIYLDNLSDHIAIKDRGRFQRSLDAHALFYSACLSGSRLHYGDEDNAKLYFRKTIELAKGMAQLGLKEKYVLYAGTSMLNKFRS